MIEDGIDLENIDVRPTLSRIRPEVENTTCGGTVKVALASADTNCISQYWAVLYDSAGAVQARQNLSAAGKADFANLSSGTYKVKLEKKDGSDTHPTALSATVVSTYRRFSVDMTSLDRKSVV